MAGGGEKKRKDKGDEAILGLAQSWYNALDVLWMSSGYPLVVLYLFGRRRVRRASWPLDCDLWIVNGP